MTSASRSLSSSGGSTSRTLLDAVRERDAGAWDRLVALYSPFVFRCCQRAGLAQGDVADVFQEVFQAALTKIASFEKRVDGGSFRGWLRTITRNKVHDHYRRLKRGPRAAGGSEMQRTISRAPAPLEDLEPFEEIALTDEEADREMLGGALNLVREHFTEKTWRAFLQTAVDGRSAKDVADDLGMTPGAVRVAKSRVLQRIRTELGDLT